MSNGASLQKPTFNVCTTGLGNVRSWWRAACPLSGVDRVKADTRSGDRVGCSNARRWWNTACPVSGSDRDKQLFVQVRSSALDRTLVVANGMGWDCKPAGALTSGRWAGGGANDPRVDRA